MLKKLGYVAIGLCIWFVGMFVGHLTSPDQTAVRQIGILDAEIASGTAAYNQMCAGIAIQNKSLIAMGAPSDQVTLHCKATPFSPPTSTLQ